MIPLNVHRRVYGTPLEGNLAGVPIDSYELFKQATSTAPKPPVVPAITVPPISSTVSPYIQNYYQRTAAEIAAANAPEVIESDEFIE